MEMKIILFPSHSAVFVLLIFHNEKKRVGRDESGWWNEWTEFELNEEQNVQLALLNYTETKASRSKSCEYSQN